MNDEQIKTRNFEKLQRLYPHYDRQTLFEIFKSCDHSVIAVKLLISNDSIQSSVFSLRKDNASDGSKTTNKRPRNNSNNTETEKADLNSMKSHSSANSANIDYVVMKKPRATQSSSAPRKYQRSIFNFFQTPNKKECSDFAIATKDYYKPSKVPLQTSYFNVLSDKTSTKRKSRTVYLNYDDIADHLSFFTFHNNFLPEDVANELLEYFLHDTEGYIKREFYVFDKKAHTDHLQCSYSRLSNTTFYNGVKEKTKKYNDLLKTVEDLVAEKVNLEISKRRRMKHQSKQPWEGNYCVINKYESKDQIIDWHSDRLTYIGPHCIIASLSLGTTRLFCVRNYVKGAVDQEQVTYNIGLTHNSLSIMHAGFQEQYQHSVRSNLHNNTNYEAHSILGETRINLTFRNHLMKHEEVETCDKCNCKMMLRIATKGNNVGKYIWLCTGSIQGQQCNGFKWAKYNS